MTEKRFILKDIGYCYDNGKLLNSTEMVECLNALHEENTHIKTTLNNMIQSERTELGKSVLKQLKEQIK